MVKKVCPRCQEDHVEEPVDCPRPKYDDSWITDISLEALLPNDRLCSPIKLKVLKLLQCPINWEEIIPNYPIKIALEKYWREVSAECLNPGADPDNLPNFDRPDADSLEIAIRREELLEGEQFSDYFNTVLLEIEDDGDLEKDLPAIERWIERAQATYQKAVFRFEKMRMATGREHSKHFPPANLSVDEIRKRTTRPGSASLFYKGVTPERLQDILWLTLGETWRQLLNVQNEKIYVDAITTVGASGGEDTSFICFDLDLSTPLAHAYPVSEQEIPSNTYIASWDNLQGYVENGI
jgi:hypothetical protein